MGDPAHRTTSGVYRAVQSTALATRLQWGAIGAVGLSIATGFGWAINKMDMVNTASAQTMSTASLALDVAKTNAVRIEAIDAGTRSAVERLERKIDANNERAEAMRQTLIEVLREVKKR